MILFENVYAVGSNDELDLYYIGLSPQNFGMRLHQ